MKNKSPTRSFNLLAHFHGAAMQRPCVVDVYNQLAQMVALFNEFGDFFCPGVAQSEADIQDQRSIYRVHSLPSFDNVYFDQLTAIEFVHQ